jgi:hypothetical protein
VKWYVKYRRKASWIVKRWKIWKKSRLNSEMIWKIWKKGKLNGEMIWKLWKKIVKWYGNYGRKVIWKVKRFKKIWKKIVKRFGKYRRKASWIVKRYENYGRKQSKNLENMAER